MAWNILSKRFPIVFIEVKIRWFSHGPTGAPHFRHANFKVLSEGRDRVASIQLAEFAFSRLAPNCTLGPFSQSDACVLLRNQREHFLPDYLIVRFSNDEFVGKDSNRQLRPESFGALSRRIVHFLT